MKLLITLLLLTVSVSAQWHPLGKYKTKTVSAARVTRAHGGVIGWFKITERRRTAKALIAFDCRNDRIRQVQLSDRKGVIGDWGEFFYIAPGTFGEWLHMKMCVPPRLKDFNGTVLMDRSLLLQSARNLI